MQDLFNTTFFRFVCGFVGILLLSFTVLVIINIYAPNATLLDGDPGAAENATQQTTQ